LNHLSTEFSPRPNLKYPFEKGFHPKPGEPKEVADGVYWMHVPMPISLDHINLWLLRDGDGWVIVDSGLDSPICKQVWDQVFDSFLTPESVKRIIVTHFHPDHIGLASWLARRCECKIWITKGEFNHYQAIVNREPKTHTIAAKQFVDEIGFPEGYADTYMRFFSVDEKDPLSRVQEEQCEFIKDGDELLIDGKRWQIVMGNGHSPEHACLYCAELATLISGDQALPRISSNISVYIINRLEDPLGDWLDSCARLRDTIPNDTLVLPSHQEPFIGLDLRMQQLIDDHHAQLNRLRLKVVEPTTAFEACSVLFDRELNEGETLMATGETLAHINYLWHRDEVSREPNINSLEPNNRDSLIYTTRK
jgi:glyoxylase-like metal-dependent hydrolase (beta-lactamase superfamily II)